MLKVQISGEAGEGKTTIALIINEALKAAGFEVELVDDSTPFMARFQHAVKLAALKDKPVLVSTLSLRSKSGNGECRWGVEPMEKV